MTAITRAGNYFKGLHAGWRAARSKRVEARATQRAAQKRYNEWAVTAFAETFAEPVKGVLATRTAEMPFEISNVRSAKGYAIPPPRNLHLFAMRDYTPLAAARIEYFTQQPAIMADLVMAGELTHLAASLAVDGAATLAIISPDKERLSGVIASKSLREHYAFHCAATAGEMRGHGYNALLHMLAYRMMGSPTSVKICEVMHTNPVYSTLTEAIAEAKDDGLLHERHLNQSYARLFGMSIETIHVLRIKEAQSDVRRGVLAQFDLRLTFANEG